MLAPNARVRIQKNRSHPSLNGTHGLVIGYSESPKRYKVEFAQGEVVALPPRVLKEQPSPDDFDETLERAQTTGALSAVECDHLTDKLARHQATDAQAMRQLEVAMKASKLAAAYRTAKGVSEDLSAFDGLTPPQLDGQLIMCPAERGEAETRPRFGDLHERLKKGQIILQFGDANSFEQLAMLDSTIAVDSKDIRAIHATTGEWMKPQGVGGQPPPEDLYNSYLEGKPLIIVAAEADNATAITALLSRGANIEGEAAWAEQRPLYCAMLVGAVNAAAALIAAGADTNARSGNGAAPLHIAAERGFPKCIELLHEARVDLNDGRSDVGECKGQTALCSAACHNNAETVRTLCRLGADVNKPSASTGLQPIHMTVGPATNPDRRNPQCVPPAPDALVALLECGANVDAIGRDGFTPLHATICTGDQKLEFVKLLVQRGANPNSRSDGNTVLETAVLSDQVETARFLLSLKKVVDGLKKLTNKKGGNAPMALMQMAAGHASAQMIELLLAHGVPGVDAPSQESGTTPVIYAALMGQPAEVFNALAAGGADVHKVVPTHGGGAAQAAAQMGDSGETMRALHALGVNLSAADNYGFTAAHLAVSEGPATTLNAPLLQVLHELGAEMDGITMVNRAGSHPRGVTPVMCAMHLARFQCWTKPVQVLYDGGMISFGTLGLAMRVQISDCLQHADDDAWFAELCTQVHRARGESGEAENGGARPSFVQAVVLQMAAQRTDVNVQETGAYLLYSGFNEPHEDGGRRYAAELRAEGVESALKSACKAHPSIKGLQKEVAKRLKEASSPDMLCYDDEGNVDVEGSYRFQIGARVLMMRPIEGSGSGAGGPGTVTRLNYTQSDFPSGCKMPYQVRLDSGSLIMIPFDTDAWLVAVPPGFE